MITFKEQLIKVIFASITELNGDDTEEELNMIISERIAEQDIQEMKKNIIAQKLESEIDIENKEMNGAYVYSYESMSNWMFKKFETIADAVREAVTMINAIVICDGDVITYDVLDDGQAYYIDNRVEKAKIVRL